MHVNGFDPMSQDRIIGEINDAFFVVIIGLSTDETTEWRTDAMSNSSISICDIIDERSDVMMERSLALSCWFIEQARSI
jgi:hypothetical protein